MEQAALVLLLCEMAVLSHLCAMEQAALVLLLCEMAVLSHLLCDGSSSSGLTSLRDGCAFASFVRWSKQLWSYFFARWLCFRIFCAMEQAALVLLLCEMAV